MTSITRKMISINFDSSNVSYKSIMPRPRYSSAVGKVYERNKPRKVASPTWEIRSAYPLRENIWEYLNEDKSVAKFNCSSKGRTRAPCCKQADGRKKTAANNKMWLVLFCILLCVLMMTYSRLSEFILRSKFMTKVVPKTRLISLLNSESSVDEECCHVMKTLAASLMRAEQALSWQNCCPHARSTHYYDSATARWTLDGKNAVTVTVAVDEIESLSSMYEKDNIEDATVTRGSETEAWGSRVALWGVLPLWRSSPPPNTVLALRTPVPSDCWPFSGSRGEMIIQLAQLTEVRRISIQHIRPDTAKSAPKNFLVYGVLENGTWIKSIEDEYKDPGPAIQFFELKPKIAPLQRLVLRILSNQGNPKYTCVYRVHFYRKSD